MRLTRIISYRVILLFLIIFAYKSEEVNNIRP